MGAENIARHALVFKTCVFLVTLGVVGTLPLGIAVIVLTAQTKFQSPIASCSGVWAPLLMLPYVIIGILCIKKYDFTGDPTSPKKMVVGMYMSHWYTWSVMIQHIVWASLGVGFCASGSLDVCTTDNRTAMLAMTSLILVLAICMSALIPLAIYLGCKGHLAELSGLVVKRQGCCSYKITPLYDEQKTNHA